MKTQKARLIEIQPRSSFKGLAARSIVLIVTLLFTGCTPSTPPADSPQIDNSPPPMKGKIHIRFPKRDRTFTQAEVARGVTFNYAIGVDQDIENVTPQPQDTGQAAGPGPSGLYPFETITGNGQSYSLIDLGLGPVESQPRTIRKGEHLLSVHWDGRNWTGPSDYDHPKGAPFPPGHYTLEVRLVGSVKTADGEEPYEITKSVRVTLTQ